MVLENLKKHNIKHISKTDIFRDVSSCYFVLRLFRKGIEGSPLFQTSVGELRTRPGDMDHNSTVPFVLRSDSRGNVVATLSWRQTA